MKEIVFLRVVLADVLIDKLPEVVS